ncbi:hypothetical protein MOKP4_50340 [Mycobacterium avium subsp. hominissuis]
MTPMLPSWSLGMTLGGAYIFAQARRLRMKRHGTTAGYSFAWAFLTLTGGDMYLQALAAITQYLGYRLNAVRFLSNRFLELSHGFGMGANS